MLRRYKRCSFHAILRAHFCCEFDFGGSDAAKKSAQPLPPSAPSLRSCRRRTASASAEESSARPERQSALGAAGLRPQGSRGEWAGARRYKALLRLAATPSRVARWLRAVCRHVVPAHLVGSVRNWRVFSRNLYHLLTRPPAQQAAAAGAILVSGLRTSECGWLQQAHASRAEAVKSPILHQRQQEALRLLLQWLGRKFLLPLTQRMFHVALVPALPAAAAPSVCYWPRGVYLRMRRLATRRVRRTLLHRLDPPVAADLLASPERALGYCELRLLPKPGGSFRTICDLSRAPRRAEAFGQAEPVNAQLKPAFELLTAMRKAYPQLLGASCLGLDEVHARWRQFVCERRRVASSARLRFVTTDLANCYDTIVQSQLWAALNAALEVRGEHPSICKRIDLHKPHDRCAEFVTRYLSKPCNRDDYPLGIKLFERLAHERSAALYVDKQRTSALTIEQALSVLRQHIFCNISRVDGQFYVHSSGVPQGSILSALLCCVHYGALDLAVLVRYLVRLKSGHVAPRQLCALLRLIDDSLMVTCENEVYSSYVCSMEGGFDAHGAHINTAKTRKFMDSAQEGVVPGAVDAPYLKMAEAGAASIATAHSSEPSATDGFGREYFAWCGSMINVRTCEVHSDCAHRAPKQHAIVPGMRSRLPSARLVRKLCGALKPKLRAIFVDQHINSNTTIRRNIHRGFLHCLAVGFAATGRALAVREPGTVAQALGHLLCFAARVVRMNQRRCAQMVPAPTAGGPAFLTVQFAEIEWLAWAALLSILPRNSKVLIQTATRRLKAIEVPTHLNQAQLDHLMSACDPKAVILKPRDAV